MLHHALHNAEGASGTFPGNFCVHLSVDGETFLEQTLLLLPYGGENMC